ncbi:hypothetical protein Tco_1537542, partial [Tanacetum coccineum]
MIFLEGLYLASLSASSAIFDLVPAITFVVASIVGKGPKLLNAQLPPSNSVLLNTSDTSDDLLASRLFMSLWQQLLLVLLANYSVMNDLRRRVEAKRGNEKQRRFRVCLKLLLEFGSRGYVHCAEVAVDASKPVHGHL